jgi:RNA polymerase sigma-70 factor (ECF subfamily)
MISAEHGSLLSEVFTRYGKVLARSIARLVRPHEVEDIVQETYMRVFQAARRQPIRSPQAFMLRTARNIALDRLALADALNHMAAPPSTEEQDDYFLAELRDEQTPEAVLESEQEFVAFCQATRALPRQCRRAFVLRKVYGLSQREVALRLGVTEGTIEKHMAKAMLECMRYMREHGYSRRSETRATGKRSRSTS